MSTLTSPWYAKPSPHEPQQPPSEEIILDDGTKGTKGTKKPRKRKAILMMFCLMVALALCIVCTIYSYHRSSSGTHAPAASSVQGTTPLCIQIGL